MQQNKSVSLVDLLALLRIRGILADLLKGKSCLNDQFGFGGGEFAGFRGADLSWARRSEPTDCRASVGARHVAESVSGGAPAR